MLNTRMHGSLAFSLDRAFIVYSKVSRDMLLNGTLSSSKIATIYRFFLVLSALLFLYEESLAMFPVQQRYAFGIFHRKQSVGAEAVFYDVNGVYVMLHR